MNKEESISINNHDVLKALKGKYLCARKQLQQARSKRQKRKLTEYIEDLKMDLAYGHFLTVESMRKGWPYTSRFVESNTERGSIMAWPGR